MAEAEIRKCFFLLRRGRQEPIFRDLVAICRQWCERFSVGKSPWLGQKGAREKLGGRARFKMEDLNIWNSKSSKSNYGSAIITERGHHDRIAASEEPICSMVESHDESTR